MKHYKYPIAMEIAGATAIWNRPDAGDAPISYPAPTASAVRGIFESILWGPDIRIVPTAVEVCAPIQYHSYVTNYGGPLRANKSIQEGNPYRLYATVLVDVCYRLYAEVLPNDSKQNLSEKALEWDGKTTAPGHAYQSIFNRRLSRGQSFAIPVLGWREFTHPILAHFVQKRRCAGISQMLQFLPCCKKYFRMATVRLIMLFTARTCGSMRED